MIWLTIISGLTIVAMIIVLIRTYKNLPNYKYIKGKNWSGTYLFYWLVLGLIGIVFGTSLSLTIQASSVKDDLLRNGGFKNVQYNPMGEDVVRIGDRICKIQHDNELGWHIKSISDCKVEKKAVKKRRIGIQYGDLENVSTEK